MTKAVVLEDESGFVLGILPSNNRLNLDWVNEDMGRDLELASEEDFENLFEDCESGAVPALGNAYGLEVIWDEQLNYATEIYIEGGDHEHLIHLHGSDFRDLMSELPHGVISASPEYSPMHY
jgi:Ala-tRNA(Pro) deacylase